MIKRYPQTTAWTVVIGAFVSFCLLCVIVGLGIYWFLYRVARRTGGDAYCEPGERQLANVEYRSNWRLQDAQRQFAKYGHD